MVAPAMVAAAFCAVGICSMVYYQNPLLVQEIFTKIARRGRHIKNDFVEKLHYVKRSKMIKVSRWNPRWNKEALSEALPTFGVQNGSGDSVPNSDLLHAPEIQAHYKGMGQQRDPTACFGPHQMEQHFFPISSFNGNNGPSEAIREMLKQLSTGQGMTTKICNDYNISQVEEQSLRNRQYYKEAVTTLQTQPLHMNDLLTLKLDFANQVPKTIYTGRNITDNDNKPIELQLIDINTGSQCTNVEGWNNKVKIEVINGDLEFEDLDSDKFNNNIVKQREGKRPLLVGNTEVTFNQQGVGTIGDICFTDNSKWIRSGEFRLGACIDSKCCRTTINIQEGLSEKFVVKEKRGLLYEKHYPPMPNDDVWRLEMIKKDGTYHQRLKDENIKSVQDFLKRWNANPSGLKEILNMKTYAWNKVLKHAQTCRMDPDNENFENNADLPKSPGLESFNQPNRMQPENMEPGMIAEMIEELSTGPANTFACRQDTNASCVPVPNAGMPHAPESQSQCWNTSIGMEAPEDHTRFTLEELGLGVDAFREYQRP